MSETRRIDVAAIIEGQRLSWFLVRRMLRRERAEAHPAAARLAAAER